MFKQKEIEDKLRTELDELIEFFGFGRELTVIYDPPPKKRKNDAGQEVLIYGEYDPGLSILYVYRQGRFTDILQTLTHEFMEYMFLPLYEAPMDSANVMQEMLLNSLTRVVKDAIEASGRVLSESHYRNKERLINVFTKVWIKRRQEK